MTLTNRKIYIFIGVLVGCLIFINSGSTHYKLQPLNKESVIVAFGDSLTHGTGASIENSYPAILAKLQGLKVVNSGIPGEISSKGLQRLPGVLAKEHPNLVILCHGGNDILRGLSFEELKANLTEMIKFIRESGSEVVLVSVPQKGILLSALPLYQELATELEIPCENEIIASVLSSRRLKSDYVHPNAEGYKQIAQAINKLINNSSH